MIPLKDNVGLGGLPALTIALIVLCVLVFGWQATLSGEPQSGAVEGVAAVVGGPSERDEFAAKNATSPSRIGGAAEELNAGPPWWLSPFTATPIAADLFHLAVDLLLLLIFGRTLEARLGRVRFAALIALGVAGSICVQALVDPDAGRLVLGTGAALASVLGGYLFLHPRAGVVTLSVIPLFGTILIVPAAVVVAAWLAIGLIPSVIAVVNSGLLVGTGLEYLGYGAALAIGAAAGAALDRSRSQPDAATLA